MTSLTEEHMDALLIKVPEAAAQLGISRAKLYELIATGAPPSVKLDGCRRIRTEDLRAYVDALTPMP
jgi:excisionase family DNA binding protein